MKKTATIMLPREASAETIAAVITLAELPGNVRTPTVALHKCIREKNSSIEY
jgi:hypothetical protein